jgi:hypothetical protein
MNVMMMMMMINISKAWRVNSYTPLITFMDSGGNYLGVSEYIN